MAVVDASVVIDWIAPGADPKSPSMETLRRLIRSNEAVLAPELLFVECVSDRRHLARAWELSRRYDNHPVYDMLHAAIAEAAGMVFITADETLLERLGNLAWVRRPGR